LLCLGGPRTVVERETELLRVQKTCSRGEVSFRCSFSQERSARHFGLCHALLTTSGSATPQLWTKSGRPLILLPRIDSYGRERPEILVAGTRKPVFFFFLSEGNIY
jgi:hypothetical protein